MGRLTQRALPLLLLPLLFVVVTSCGREKLTKPKGSGWSFELVASGREVGLHSSLDTASDGTVYIAYHDPRYHDLHLARREGAGQWTSVEVDSLGWKGEFVELCIDSNDNLHLAYQDGWALRLRYAFFDGNTWIYEHLNPRDSSGEAPVLIAHPDGIHMVELYTASRMSAGSGDVNYWHKTGTGWQLLSTLNGNFMRPYLGVSYVNGEPAIAILMKYTASAPVNTILQIVRHTAATGDGPWNTTTIVAAESYEAVKYGKNVIGFGFDESGTGHLLYLGPGNVLVDTAGDPVDDGVSDDPIVMREGPGNELWVTYLKGNNIIISRYMAGTGWKKVGSIGGAQPEGRYDFLVEDSGILHMSLYNSASQELWYGRREVQP